MIAVRAWWSQPTDYRWNVAYAQSHPILRQSRLAIGLCCVTYGLICVLSLSVSGVVSAPTGRWVVGGFALTTAVAGYLWFRGPWPPLRRSLLFIAYGEIGVSGVLMSLASPTVGLQSAVLLAVMGNYVAAFHNTKVFVAHQVWALTTCATLYIRALAETDSAVAQVTAYLVVLVLVLVSSPVLTQAYLTFLRRDAAVAHFDPLTGLRNRRGLESAVDAFNSDVTGIAVVVADLDNFKAVNDTYGHSYGDDVLRRTAEAINRAFPAPAVTARTGGEEFVVVVGGPLDVVARAAEGLRAAIPLCDSAGGTTTSIGIHYRRVHIRHACDMLDELLESADNAMYDAKRRGGDSVVIDGHDDIATCS
nr:GGDEF domain-containing protein [Rhodococcus sp. (in: high G+C Gram-positive bacteria)]